MGEDLVTYDFTLHLRANDHTIWFSKCSWTAFRHFFWALTISWSWLLAWEWSGPLIQKKNCQFNFPSHYVEFILGGLNSHVQTNISGNGVLLETLAYIVYIRQRYRFLQCAHLSRCTKRGPKILMRKITINVLISFKYVSHPNDVFLRVIFLWVTYYGWKEKFNDLLMEK